MLGMFDMFIYRQSYLKALHSLFMEQAYFHSGAWMIIAAALLAAAWQDVRDRPYVKRMLKRDEQAWIRK